MQIHELNNFAGPLGSGAYIAIDNGTDTGKKSVADLLAGVNGEIDQAKNDLNARIDNIIAGGDAPSAAEVTDARLGANGVTYPSLGAAIRKQVDLSVPKSDGIISDAQTPNLIVAAAIIYGEYFDVDGSVKFASTWWRTPLIPIEASKVCAAGSCKTVFFDSGKEYIGDNASWGGTTFTTPADCAYIAVCSNIVYTSAYLYRASNQPAL